MSGRPLPRRLPSLLDAGERLSVPRREPVSAVRSGRRVSGRPRGRGPGVPGPRRRLLRHARRASERAGDPDRRGARARPSPLPARRARDRDRDGGRGGRRSRPLGAALLGGGARCDRRERSRRRPGGCVRAPRRGGARPAWGAAVRVAFAPLGVRVRSLLARADRELRGVRVGVRGSSPSRTFPTPRRPASPTSGSSRIRLCRTGWKRRGLSRKTGNPRERIPRRAKIPEGAASRPKVPLTPTSSTVRA